MAVSLIKEKWSVYSIDYSLWHRRPHYIAGITIFGTYGMARRAYDRDKARGERVYMRRGEM